MGNRRLQLGFNFSFPCHQTSLDRVRQSALGDGSGEGLQPHDGRRRSDLLFCPQSILISWTKGFRCSGVEGQDVVQLLRDAIKRQGVSGGGTAWGPALCFWEACSPFLHVCLVCCDSGRWYGAVWGGGRSVPPLVLVSR